MQVAEPRLALAAVPGHAGQVVDQRQAPPDQPVEQRRLADVRPADDRNTKGTALCRTCIISGGRRSGQPEAVGFLAFVPD